MAGLTRLQQWLTAVCTGLLLVGFVLGSRYVDRRARAEFKTFDAANLRGVLSRVDSQQRSVGIRLQGSLTRFMFYPRTDENLNQGHHFHLWAKPGDSVVKTAHADTLYLLKRGIVYRYPFKQFEQRP